MDLLDVSQLGLGRWRGRSYPKLVRVSHITGLSLDPWENGEDEENGEFVVTLHTVGNEHSSAPTSLERATAHFNAVMNALSIARVSIPADILASIPQSTPQPRSTRNYRIRPSDLLAEEAYQLSTAVQPSQTLTRAAPVPASPYGTTEDLRDALGLLNPNRF